MSEQKDVIHSRIWEEVPEADNPFAAKTCYCAGYDVYGDMLGKASWFEYLFLLFTGERSEPWQAKLLETLAVVLANPGPRDHSVRAAMNGGIGGAHSAASLMGALGVGAGQLGGGRDVYSTVAYWEELGLDLPSWVSMLKAPLSPGRVDAWLPIEHPPGFDPNGVSCPAPLRQSLDLLAQIGRLGALDWIRTNRLALEAAAGMPLAMSGVAAAAFVELGFNRDQSEMLYLIMRLPGAAVHTLEQRKFGRKRYPFWADGVKVVNDPGRYEGELGGEILAGVK